MKIQNAKDLTSDDKFRVMLYGKSGSGKTKLISSIKERVLVCNADKGLKTLRKLDIDYSNIDTWEDVGEFLNYIKTDECKKKYQWVAFDSIPAMFELLYVFLTEKARNKKGEPLDSFEVWRTYKEKYFKFMSVLKTQTDYHTLSIFEDIVNTNDEGVSVQTYGLQGSSAGKVPGFYDEVLYLKIGKENIRTIQTFTSSTTIAKDRSQTLEQYEEPDLDKIMTKIKGGK